MSAKHAITAWSEQASITLVRTIPGYSARFLKYENIGSKYRVDSPITKAEYDAIEQMEASKSPRIPKLWHSIKW